MVHLAALDNVRKLDIGTFQNDREGGHLFILLNIELQFLWYVNDALFEMVKTFQKHTYIRKKNPTTLQNEVSTFW